MIVRFWAVSRTSTSLREVLIGFVGRNQRQDPGEFPIRLGKKQKPRRNPGWAKAYSRTGSLGVINFEWNERAHLLEGQAVSRRGHHPYLLLGEFISVVMRLPGKSVKSIHIEVDRKSKRS